MIYFKDISGREHFVVGHGQGVTVCLERRRVIHKETTAKNLKAGPVSSAEPANLRSDHQLSALHTYSQNTLSG